MYSFMTRSVRNTPLVEGLYASVVLDIQARELRDRLFTYRVPDYLSPDTFIGAQVLVPFGTQQIGGYVVSLSETTPEVSFKTKDIFEVVEPEPLFDKQYIEFLHWLATYYCASLSDVIAAAIPACLSPRFKKQVRMSQSIEGEAAARLSLSSAQDKGLKALLQILNENKKGTASLSALRKRWMKQNRLPSAHFYRALNFLKEESFVEIETESTSIASPKLSPNVIWTGQEPRTPRQKEVLAVLSRHSGQMALKDLLEAAGTTHATIKKMEQDGVLAVVYSEVYRDPLKRVEGTYKEPPQLTEHQENALSILVPALVEQLASDNSTTILDEREFGGQRLESIQPVKPFLLHGVTGSGKTEVYLRLIDETLKRGRSALMMVPEISLTPQLAGRLKERFGDQVCVWHSALSQGERYDTWRRLRAGEAKILLGARSAVLAHLPDVGLIILDEEHDGSYKQTSPSPRYHARDVALEKARRHGALVVLGSATPDVATYKAAKEDERILELPERVFKQEMPEVKIIDMREEFKFGNKGVFSLALQQELAGCLERKEQSILLMNRRGYASHVFCRACGHVVRCRNCSVSLVFHQRPGDREGIDGYLSCHHCGFRKSGMDTCPACHGPFIRQFGLGTQRIEEEVRQKFPKATVVRLDSDVAQRKGAHEEVLGKFAKGGIDILIGTQMVSKGLDIAGVTLVGVLAADGAFNLPDYRSIERGFQLLTQVSGRAGRGEKPGRVILQTYSSDLDALRWASKHDYATFVEAELQARETFCYPPFSQLIRTVIAGADLFEVEAATDRLAEEISTFLEAQLSDADMRILGPAPCLIERLRGKYRYQLLVKNLAGQEAGALLTRFLRNRKLSQNVSLAVDVDACDLL